MVGTGFLVHFKSFPGLSKMFNFLKILIPHRDRNVTNANIHKHVARIFIFLIIMNKGFFILFFVYITNHSRIIDMLIRDIHQKLIQYISISSYVEPTNYIIDELKLKLISLQ